MTQEEGCKPHPTGNNPELGLEDEIYTGIFQHKYHHLVKNLSEINENEPVADEKKISILTEKDDNIVQQAQNDDHIDRHKSNIKKRDAQLRLISWLKRVIGIWLAIVLLIVIVSPFMGYSDPVIIALLTTTTVNVLGLFIIALNWLYPKTDNWS